MNSRRCTDCLHPIPQAIAMSHEQLCVAAITHFMGASPRANSLLLFVAYVIHSKHVTGTILNRFVSGGIGLRCLDLDGKSVYSLDFSDDEWQALVRENRKARHLRTPCCNSPLMLKRSRRGTPFFAI